MSLELLFKLRSHTNVHNYLSENRVAVNFKIGMGAWRFLAKSYNLQITTFLWCICLVFELVFEINNGAVAPKTKISFLKKIKKEAGILLNFCV